MASMDIITLLDTWQCCHCFLTAHAAALPVSPFWYELMNLQEWLINHQIMLGGHALSYRNAISFTSVKFCFGSS
jgi:hypothetical protein